MCLILGRRSSTGRYFVIHIPHKQYHDGKRKKKDKAGMKNMTKKYFWQFFIQTGMYVIFFVYFCRDK